MSEQQAFYQSRISGRQRLYDLARREARRRRIRGLGRCPAFTGGEDWQRKLGDALRKPGVQGSSGCEPEIGRQARGPNRNPDCIGRRQKISNHLRGVPSDVMSLTKITSIRASSMTECR